MNKYDALWRYVADSGQDTLTLGFDEIAQIAGVPIDHSFLRCKKELTARGYAVGKISMKQRTVTFEARRAELASAADIESWMRLVCAVRGSFPGLETEEALKAHRHTVLTFMERHEAVCVRSGKKIIGALLFSRADNELCFLAVAPAYRRQHIAEQLVRFALPRMTPARPVTVTTYRAGVPEGEAARAFYQKLSFVPGHLTEIFGSEVQEFIRE